MLTSGRQSEEEQRLNAVLQKLSGITFVPDGTTLSNIETLFTQLEIPFHELATTDSSILHQKLNDAHWSWQQMEQLADIFVKYSNTVNHEHFKEKAKKLYQYIQITSQTFSFDIHNKMNQLP